MTFVGLTNPRKNSSVPVERSEPDENDKTKPEKAKTRRVIVRDATAPETEVVVVFELQMKTGESHYIPFYPQRDRGRLAANSAMFQYMDKLLGLAPDITPLVPFAKESD